MIKINDTIKKFLDYCNNTELMQKAYEYTIKCTLDMFTRDFEEWSKVLAPYEEELVNACKTVKQEDCKPWYYDGTFEIQNTHEVLKKFCKNEGYEYFDPNEEDMALYLYVKYPELKQFIGVDYDCWSDGSVDSVTGIIYTEEAIADSFSSLTLEELRLLYNGNFTVEDYVKRHPLAEVE